MRRTLTIFILLAALVVPAAHAETGPPATGTEPSAGETKQRQGDQRRQGMRCRPGAVLVAGAFVRASEDGFSMLVRRANRKGHSLVGKTVEVTVLRRTHLRGLGDLPLSEVPARTRVVADLRVCKARGAEGEAARPELVAAKAAFHLQHMGGEPTGSGRPEAPASRGQRPA
jgi:hypothetical protein